MENFRNWQVTLVICTTLLTVVLSQSGATEFLNIVSEPLDQVFLEDSGRRNVAFMCSAAGNPAPEILWMRNDLQVVENSKYQITANGDLVINNPQRSDHGDMFWCKAQNNFGAFRSRTATLEIAYIGNPAIANRQVTTLANKGLCLNCEPPEASPGIYAKWFRTTTGNFIQPSKRTMVLTDGQLCFANIKRSDAGNYECYVANSYDPNPLSHERSVYVNLTVTQSGEDQPLRRVDVPINVTARQGEEAVLQCVFLSKPLPTLQWTRVDGRPIGSGVSRTGYQLRIPNAQASDSGEYTCTATREGDRRSQTITQSQYLTVKSPPVLTTELTDTEVNVGSSASLQCVSDNSTDDYSWYKNTEPLRFNDRVQKKTSTSIYIKAALRADTGIYQCSVSNRFGTVFSTAQLRVNRGTGNKQPEKNEPGESTGTGGNSAVSLAGSTGLLLIMVVYQRVF